MYIGDYLFASRMIDKWYYDGTADNTARGLKDSRLSAIDRNNLIKTRQGRTANLVIYTLDNELEA